MWGKRLLGMVLALIVGLTAVIVTAQTGSARLEFASVDSDGNVILHVMVPRGQTIEQASLQIEGETIALETGEQPLPATRWLVVDASDSLLNLQPAVQSALQRFLRNTEGLTGLIFYDSSVMVLQPTDSQDEIDTFLAQYNATANQPGCLADALNTITTNQRDLDRSLRIMLITGQLSQSARCAQQDLSAVSLSAPLDVVAISDTVSDDLRDLTARSGGSVVTASLRTVEARINEVRTLWSQPTYALFGTIEAGQPSALDQLTITLASGVEEQLDVRLQQLVEPTPTPQPTAIILPTIPPRPTDTPFPTPELPTATATGLEPPATSTDVTQAAEATDDIQVAVIATHITTATQDSAAIVAPIATDLPLEPSEIPVAPTPAPDADNSGNNSTQVIVIGAIVVLAVALVVAGVVMLQRQNVTPEDAATLPPSGNFYETLDRSNDDAPTQAPRQTGQRVQQPVTPVDRKSGDRQGMEAAQDREEMTEFAPDEYNVYDEYDEYDDYDDDAETMAGPQDSIANRHAALSDDDELLITKILSDEQFLKMMQGDDDDGDDVVAWLRLDGETSSDYALTKRGAVIGRSQECDIIILNDSATSRKHARLDVEADGQVTITRLSATNPVVVGGVLVRNKHPLKPNDVIHLSDKTRLIFITQNDMPSKPVGSDAPHDDSQDDYDDDAITKL